MALANPYDSGDRTAQYIQPVTIQTYTGTEDLASLPTAPFIQPIVIVGGGGGSSSLVIGGANPTPISGGTAGKFLYDLGTTIGETSGISTVDGNALKATTLALGGATIGANALAVTGSVGITGSLIATGGVTGTAGVASGGNIQVGAASSLNWVSGNSIVSPTTSLIQFGGLDIAAPVAQTIGPQGVVAGTPNTNGQPFTHRGSAGTGTGLGGSHIFTVATAGSTGSTQNAQVTALTIAQDLSAKFAGAVSIGGATIGSNALAVTGLTSLDGGTVTANNPVLNLLQTWSNGAVGFDGISLNVIPSASSGQSNLINLKTNGATQFNVTAANGATTAGAGFFTGNLLAHMSNSNGFVVGGTLIGYSFTNGTTTTATRDLFLTRAGAANLRIGDFDAAAPVAQTIGPQSVVAGTSNTNGAAFTIRGSVSTGSGASGDIILSTGGTGAGATAQNAQVAALTLKGATQAAIFGSSVTTNSASFALRSGTTITGGATGNVPTLSAGPVTGNPTKWLPYDDNGTTRYIPAW